MDELAGVQYKGSSDNPFGKHLACFYSDYFIEIPFFPCLCIGLYTQFMTSLSWHLEMLQMLISPTFPLRLPPATSGNLSCLTHSGQCEALLPYINPETGVWFSCEGFSLLPGFTGMSLLSATMKRHLFLKLNPARSLISLTWVIYRETRSRHHRVHHFSFFQSVQIQLLLGEIKYTKRTLKQVSEIVKKLFILTQGDHLSD